MKLICEKYGRVYALNDKGGHTQTKHCKGERKTIKENHIENSSSLSFWFAGMCQSPFVQQHNMIVINDIYLNIIEVLLKREF